MLGFGLGLQVEKSDPTTIEHDSYLQTHVLRCRGMAGCRISHLLPECLADCGHG